MVSPEPGFPRQESGVGWLSQSTYRNALNLSRFRSCFACSSPFASAWAIVAYTLGRGGGQDWRCAGCQPGTARCQKCERKRPAEACFLSIEPRLSRGWGSWTLDNGQQANPGRGNLKLGAFRRPQTARQACLRPIANDCASGISGATGRFVFRSACIVVCGCLIGKKPAAGCEG